MLKAVQLQLGTRAVISQPFQRLCHSQNQEVIDRITRRWAEARHELTLAERGELLGAVRLLANVCHAVFCKHAFGFFQGVQKEPFSNRHRGRFRVAHGKPPHTSFVLYSGTQSFSEAEALLLNLERGEGLSLTPLIFWYSCRTHRDHENGHCYLFDKIAGVGDNATARYKAGAFPCSLELTAVQSEMADLLAQLAAFKSQDPRLETVRSLTFTVTAEGHR